MEEQGIKIETSIWDNLLYEIWKNRKGKEEVRFAGVDMGNRTYLVKWIDDKTFIAKTPSCNVLCGARGCGMVFPFPTKYILCKIDPNPLPKDYTAWTGRLTITHEMTCGRQWKDGIKQLEELAKTI